MDAFLSFYKYFNSSEGELKYHFLNRKEYDCTNSENIYSCTEILKVKSRVHNTSHNFEIAEEMEQLRCHYREMKSITSLVIIKEKLTIPSLCTSSSGESVNTLMLYTLLTAVYICCASAKS